MSQPIDIVRRSLPVPERLVLEGVEQTETGIIVRVRGEATPQCPACSSCQVSYHSQYQRQLHDLPWQGQPVRLHSASGVFGAAIGNATGRFSRNVCRGWSLPKREKRTVGVKSCVGWGMLWADCRDRGC